MVWKFMSAGGWCMLPIVVCSILGLALLLERAFHWIVLWLRRDDALRGELAALVLDRRRAERTKDPVCRVLLALITHPDDPSVATGEAERVLREAKKGLPVLNMIAGVACSLGLFGTVLGVSLSFEALALSRPQDLALSLAVALNTTLLGLFVYLPVYVGSSILATLTGRLGFEMERAANAMGQRQRSKNHGLGRVTMVTP